MERTSGILGWSRWIAGWWSLPIHAQDGAEFPPFLGCWAASGSVARASDIALADKRVRADRTLLEWRDFGAGASDEGRMRQTAVADLAAAASTDARKGRWLSGATRAVSEWRGGAIRILELGTCLGAGADHLLSGAGEGSEYLGLEGSEELAGITRSRLSRHAEQGKGVRIESGPFSKTLPMVLEGDPQFDVVFIDGRHEGEVLLEQVRSLQSVLAPGACVIIDDIRWSGDMFRAWRGLCAWPGAASLDLFRMGIWIRPGLHRPTKATMRPKWWQRA